MNIRALLVVCFTGVLCARVELEKPLVVVVPSYNNERSIIEQNLKSIAQQEYQNWRGIYIDDCSPNGTGGMAQEVIKALGMTDHFVVVKNKTRHLALNNIYRAVMSCRNDEIVLIVDGDDKLAHKQVFQRINDAYSTKPIWLTHGNFKSWSRGALAGWGGFFPPAIVKRNLFREWPHGLVHLRTFYAGLFKQIRISDLFYEGAFFKMSYDVGILLPMVEMAGERYHYFSEPLYIYNDLNPINDHKVDMKQQHFLNRFIRQKQRYTRLDTFFPSPLSGLASDMLIFSESSPGQLRLMLTTISYHVSGLRTIYALYTATDAVMEAEYAALSLSFPGVFIMRVPDDPLDFRSLLQAIFTAKGSEYIALTHDAVAFYAPLDISAAVQWLEMTHAYGFFFKLEKKTFEVFAAQNQKKEYPVPALLSLMPGAESVYAWQYGSFYQNGFGKLIDFSVFKKSDLLFLAEHERVLNKKHMEGEFGNDVSALQIGLFYEKAKVGPLPLQR